MSITPQDILEQEFRVRFRGFDMAEVDAFLERVAESYFRLVEENKNLNEQVEALQKSSAAPGSQDTNLQEVIASVQQVASEIKALDRQPPPVDLAETLSEIKQAAEKIHSGLTALQEEREAYSSLRETIEEIAAAAKEAAGKAPSAAPVDTPSGLPTALDELRQSTENVGSEVADLKKEISGLQQARDQLKSEMQDLLQLHLGKFEERVLKELRGAVVQTPEPETVPSKKPAKKAKAKAPKQKEKVMESRVLEDDAELPDYDEKELDDGTKYDEADILNEDKLRDLFASIMDDDDSPAETGGATDMLFGGGGMVEDDHEPEVTFILEDALEEEPGTEAGNKPDN